MIQTIHLPTIGTFDAWRDQARACLMAGQRPETLRWVMGADGGDLFDAPAAPPATDGPPPNVPRAFVALHLRQRTQQRLLRVVDTHLPLRLPGSVRT